MDIVLATSRNLEVSVRARRNFTHCQFRGEFQIVFWVHLDIPGDIEVYALLSLHELAKESGWS